MIFAAFILGFLGSLHCIGMCGPIAFMLPVAKNNTLKKAMQVAIYHFGRLLAYSIIGMVFGVLGKGLYIFGLQQKLSIGIGVLMIVLILLPSKYSNRFKVAKTVYKLFGKVKSKLGNAFKKQTNDAFITIGFLNGFLPCGLVYMALFGAIAMGNVLQGGLYMLLFGLGTVPLMSLAIYFGSMLTGLKRKKIQKLIPIFVLIIGVLFILRGLGLGIPYVSPKPVVSPVSSVMECSNNF